MNFKIKRELLLNTVINASKGLSNKLQMPILTGVLLSVNEQSATFITSNKEISIQIVIPTGPDLIVESGGECIVPGKYFLDIVRKIEGDTVEFSLFDESTIKIVADHSDFTLIAFNREDFPNYSFEISGTTLSFESKVLKKMIQHASFACSVSETRVILMSVNFKIINNHLTVTATDSFRLSKQELDLNSSNGLNLQVNVPAAALNELEKILTDSNDIVEMQIENNKALFKFNNICFMTRLIEGDYPDTSSLCPKEFLLHVTFNKDELLSAVDRASLFTNSDNLSIVKITLNNTNCVEISSNSTEVGKAVEEVYPIAVSEMQSFQIAFSTKYIMDALKALNSKQVSFYFTGEIKPAVILGDENKYFLQLILPVRVF